MIEYRGKYATAKVFTDILEPMATSQVYNLINSPLAEDSKIRIQVDAHAGAGCVVGLTMTITDKVCPNLVGVDIGCFVGDTKIALLNGTQKTIKMLTEENKPFYVYSINKNKEVTYGKATAMRTRTNATLVAVTISGGAEIICTPDHKFMLHDGTYKEAKDLNHLDSLMPLHRTYETREGYEHIIQPHNKKLPKATHKLIMSQMRNGEEYKGVIHHINENKFDNSPENLILLSAKEHGRVHGKENGELFKTEQFKKHRMEQLQKNGFFASEFLPQKQETARKTILKYMKENKEDFKKVTEANGERGSKFFGAKNNDSELKARQFYGKIRKILIILEKNEKSLNETNYEKVRKQFYNYPTYETFMNKQEIYNIPLQNIITNNMDAELYYNHKVLSVIELDYKEDVYCLNVAEHHNFALASGVFVHNCGMSVYELGKVNKNLMPALDVFINENIPSGAETQSDFDNPVGVFPKLNDLRCLKHINIDRALDSIGTLGGGNHYIEVDVDEKENAYLVVHSGSRHLGLEVAKYYQDEAFKNCNRENKQKIIDALKAQGRHNEIEAVLSQAKTPIAKDLTYLTGATMQDYLHDTKIIQAYASHNRKTMLLKIIKDFFHEAFKPTAYWETIHNYVDVENMIVRKGAVSAQKGERIFIPMNMRDGGIIAIGKGATDYNFSAPHGAGRVLSRSKAKTNLSLDDYKETMKGIYTTSVCQSTLDEAPDAYKPMADIIKNIAGTVEIEKIIKPIYNFKASKSFADWRASENKNYKSDSKKRHYELKK